MQLIITNDYEELSERAAKIIIATVKANPYAVLGLATGTTRWGCIKGLLQTTNKIRQATSIYARSIWTSIRDCRPTTVRAMRILCAKICSGK